MRAVPLVAASVNGGGPPGLTSVRQPLEEVAVEVVRALEGLLGHPPVVGPGVLLTPELIIRGSS